MNTMSKVIVICIYSYYIIACSNEFYFRIIIRNIFTIISNSYTSIAAINTNISSSFY